MDSRNKILFLGDSFIGKSSLIHTLCGIGSQPQSTLGCSIQVQIFPHQFLAGTPGETTELLEFWDIDGSKAHREASSVFMEGADGVVLVHDLNNMRSEQHLPLWLDLLYSQTSRHRRHGGLKLSSNLSMSDTSSILSVDRSGIGGGGDASGGAASPAGERFIALDMDRVFTIPILIVGTGLDQSDSKKRQRATEHSPLVRAHDHVMLDARRPIAPGSTNRVVFSNFFDQVVRHAAESARSGGMGGATHHHHLGGGDGAGMPRYRAKGQF